MNIKSIRDLDSKPADINAVVFDLKVVIPNAVAEIDTRPPREIIANINEHERIVFIALAKLSGLLVVADE